MAVTAAGIMAGVGALSSIGGALFGAISAANARKRARKLINTQREENKRWYNQQMAQDYTQRSDAQAILKKQRELLNEQYKSAAARNIVSGGTDESLALQQQAANDSLDNTMTNLAGQASAHRDSVEQQYRQQESTLNQQEVNAEMNQATNIAQAGGQVINAGLGLVGQGMAGLIKQTK